MHLNDKNTNLRIDFLSLHVIFFLRQHLNVRKQKTLTHPDAMHESKMATMQDGDIYDLVAQTHDFYQKENTEDNVVSIKWSSRTLNLADRT